MIFQSLLRSPLLRRDGVLFRQELLLCELLQSLLQRGIPLHIQGYVHEILMTHPVLIVEDQLQVVLQLALK
jgi:hypothetical protein